MARPTLAEAAQRRFEQAEVNIRDKAARYSNEALETIHSVMANTKSADSPRLRACELMLKAYNDLRIEDRKTEELENAKQPLIPQDRDEDDEDDSAVLKIGDKIIKIG